MRLDDIIEVSRRFKFLSKGSSLYGFVNYCRVLERSQKFGVKYNSFGMDENMPHSYHLCDETEMHNMMRNMIQVPLREFQDVVFENTQKNRILFEDSRQKYIKLFADLTKWFKLLIFIFTLAFIGTILCFIIIDRSSKRTTEGIGELRKLEDDIYIKVLEGQKDTLERSVREFEEFKLIARDVCKIVLRFNDCIGLRDIPDVYKNFTKFCAQ